MKALLLAMGVAVAMAGCAKAAPVKVEVVKTASGWQMLRGGKPYRIKGAAGDASMEKLKALYVRLWNRPKVTSHRTPW